MDLKARKRWSLVVLLIGLPLAVVETVRSAPRVP